MPLNGLGTYTAPASTWNPAVTNTTVSSTDWAALLADLSTALSTMIAKDGQSTPTANIPMGSFKLTGLAAGNAAGNSIRYEQLFTTNAVALLGAMDWVKGADVASAATTNLTTATGNAVHVTGTTTITAVTLGSGMWRLVIFDGALTLTHHATNNNLPGAANITTVAGDRALYWADGTTVYCVVYQPVGGKMATLTGTEVLTNKTLTAPAMTAAVLGGTTDVSGGQLKFPAAQSASADANTLDDYEEGTWTPSVGGTATYFNQVGTYTKIGRLVHITCYMRINAIGTGSATTWQGLPFANAAAVIIPLATEVTNCVTNVVSVLAYVSVSASTGQVLSRTAAQATAAVNNVFGASSELIMQGAYAA